jgi:hypothetical protein
MPRMAEHPQASVPSCGRARSCRGLLPGRRASSCTARAGAHGTSRRVRSAACRAESGTTLDGSSAALLILLLAGRSLRCPHCLPLSARDCCLRVIEAALGIVEPCDN